MSNKVGVEENSKVVVVGNGFDISVGLKSSYKDFIDYIRERNHFSEDLELYEYNRLFLRKYEDFQLNWSDFESLYEETVRNVNNRVQHEDLQDSFEITVINEAIKKLERDFYEYISDEYQKWLQKNIVPQNDSPFKKFSKNINPVIKELLSDSDAFFINFNYTDTLEDLSEDIIFEKVMNDNDTKLSETEKRAKANRQIRIVKNRIAHIHGSIEDDNILFGGGFADREDTKSIHYAKSLLNDKLFRIKENDKLSSTRKIIMDELNGKTIEASVSEEDEKSNKNVVYEENEKFHKNIVSEEDEKFSKEDSLEEPEKTNKEVDYGEGENANKNPVFEENKNPDRDVVSEEDDSYKVNEVTRKSEKFDLYILGHSLQGSDFQFLSKILNDADKVFIFYYETDYTTKMEELIRKLGSSIIEKVNLVPFVEILFEDRLLINNYKMYESIEPFLANKFPNEKILADLSLTAQHFIFKHITEITLTEKNVEIVLELAKNLYENKIPSFIKKISFSGIEEKDIQSIGNSKAFIELIATVEKISFEKTDIFAGFLHALLQKGNRLNHLIINHCIVLADEEAVVDLSVCESLVRFEIKDCTFNPEGNVQTFTFNSERSENNIKKLVIEKNANILIENSIFEKAITLLELSIVLSDTDVYENEVHLANLESLYIDCSSSFFPNITVGNDIKEITIIGYEENYFVFSTLLKNSESFFGFPKFELLQLNSPDNIRSFEDIDIDVSLDIFSKRIKFIIDEKSISIDDYYRQYRTNQNNSLLYNNTKKIVKDTIINIISPNKDESLRVFSEFEKWYKEISRLTDTEEEDENLLSSIENHFLLKLHTGEEAKEEQTTIKSEQNNPEKKSQENDSLSKIDELLFDYTINKVSSGEIINFLKGNGKNNSIIDIYDDIIKDLKEL